MWRTKMVRKNAPLRSKHPRLHVPQNPRFLQSTAQGSPSLLGQRKAWLQPMYDTENGKIWFARVGMSGQRGAVGLDTCPPFPCTPTLRHPPTHHPPQNSPSRQAQEVQEGKADPRAQRDRGHLLDRNHLRNMPYFKPVHVSRLSRCPVQGARRGQSGSRGVRTLALTLARAPPAQPRWACVCTRPGEAGPARPPPPLALAPSSSRAWAQLRTLSLRHALLTGELGSSCHAKLGKFVPTCNSGDTTHGRSSLLWVSDPTTPNGSPAAGRGGLLFSDPTSFTRVLTGNKKVASS